MTIRSWTLLKLIANKMLHDALGAKDAALLMVLKRKGITDLPHLIGHSPSWWCEAYTANATR